MPRRKKSRGYVVRKRAGENKVYVERRRAILHGARGSTLQTLSDSGFISESLNDSSPGNHSSFSNDDVQQSKRSELLQHPDSIVVSLSSASSLTQDVSPPLEILTTTSNSVIPTDKMTFQVLGSSAPLVLSRLPSSPDRPLLPIEDKSHHGEMVVVPTPHSGNAVSLCGSSRPPPILSREEPSIPCSTPLTGDQAMEVPVPNFSDDEVSLPEDIAQSLLEISSALRESLPSGWVPLVKDNGIHVGLLARTNAFIIQRSLFFTVFGGIAVTVHGRPLPESHFFWLNVDNVAWNARDVQPFVNNILRVVMHLRSLEVCQGVDDFKALWKTEEDADVDKNLFQEMRHGEVLRSNSCQVLVLCHQRKCIDCHKTRKRLGERQAANEKRVDATPPAKKPDKYCNSAEKTRRSKRRKAIIGDLEKENRRLRMQIAKLVRKEGVSIDPKTSSDLASILETSEDVDKLTVFQKIFVEQQLKAAKAKRPCGMRWHPAILRFALSIQAKSGAAYEELSAVLRLPSERTLFDYSHSMTPTDGIHHEIIGDMASKSQKFEFKYQQYYVLAFDEIHIKKNLVFNKKTGELVGYVKLDQVEQELEALNMEVNDEQCGLRVGTTKPSPPVADKMLCFLLTGVCNNLKGVVACYPRANTTKEKLHEIVWSVISTLERCGLHVNCVVCDGAAVNRGFIQMHVPITKTASGTVFDTINPWSGRPLFFMTDPPHLIKTTRNCLYSSGRVIRSKGKGTDRGKRREEERGPEPIRALEKGGQEMLWSTIVGLYEDEKDSVLRKLHKLNAEDVYLNSYSAMRVSLAAHVLSRSVAEVIRTKFKGELSEFSQFLEIMNDLFDMMNGHHSDQAHRTRNDNFKPYTDIDDPRFARMEEMWGFFEEWKTEVTNLKIPRQAKAKRLLSKETQQGLERSIRGFIGAVKYVLEEGKNETKKPYINASVYSQDPLENYFGAMRAKFGGNRHPDAGQVLQGQVAMHAQQDVAFRGRKKGNAFKKMVSGTGTWFTLKELNTPLNKRPKFRRKLVP